MGSDYLSGRAVPQLEEYAHSIDAKMAGARVDFTDTEITHEKIQRILDSDVNKVYSEPANISELFNNKVATFDGDVNSFADAARQHDSLDFAVLMYLGKARNHLKTPFNGIDLSWMALLNRLNRFAASAERLFRKSARVVVVAENGVFDSDVFGYERDACTDMVKHAQSAIKEFNMKNIGIVDLRDMCGKSKGYQDEFDMLVNGFEKSPDSTRTRRDYIESYPSFYHSYPTSSFREAVEMYSSGDAKVKVWADKVTMRYIAFLEARSNTGFWGANSEYIRATVSSKPNVLTFGYAVGRLTAAHGIAVRSGDSIGTEYFYDVISETAKNDKIAQLSRLMHGNDFVALDIGHR